MDKLSIEIRNLMEFTHQDDTFVLVGTANGIYITPKHVWDALSIPAVVDDYGPKALRAWIDEHLDALPIDTDMGISVFRAGQVYLGDAGNRVRFGTTHESWCPEIEEETMQRVIQEILEERPAQGTDDEPYPLTGEDEYQLAVELGYDLDPPGRETAQRLLNEQWRRAR